MPSGTGSGGPRCSRRAVLATVASGVGLGGCLGFGDGESTATRPATATQSPSETSTRTAPPTATATETPTATDTPTDDPDTPTLTPALNQTQYDVGMPARRSGVDTSSGPLLGGEYGVAAGVAPIRSAAEWQRVRTDGTQAVADAFEGYEFVAETDFDTETIVVIQRDRTGVRLRLRSVDGVGSPEIVIDGRRVDAAADRETDFEYLFVRLPTGGDEIERITAWISGYGTGSILVYDCACSSTPSTPST
ncbi:hypothetical protein RYH80_08105 [Halobaculum sp. MBLA0147]|uniref:hypothetical protein n=1 Tax=Halobaculum sp. MBLA0147 TaxID=3079934 RepID=UPI003525974C